MNESFINFKDAPEMEKKLKRVFVFKLLGLLIGLAFCFYFFNLFQSPNGNIYPVTIRIERGDSLPIVARKIYNAGIVKSESAFRLYTAAIGADKNLSAGIYNFEGPMSLAAIAGKIKSGLYDVPLVKLTIPEGFTNNDIINRVAAQFNQPLDSEFVINFKRLVEGKQGYLFPETYYFFPDEKPEVIVSKLEKEWANRIKGDDGVSKDVIVMASILEGESRGHDEMKVIAGILNKRISKGMYLQVDVATITYSVLGLPSEPINNPGEEAINAALHPESSPYLYYLHDSEGVVHYAKTFEEHKKNIRKYLK
jgi:UPF0755 protein